MLQAPITPSKQAKNEPEVVTCGNTVFTVQRVFCSEKPASKALAEAILLILDEQLQRQNA